MLVVAAIIEREGRFLICQRRKGRPFPMKWEFPGGKVRPDEAPEAALIRELEEELGVRATVAGEFCRTSYQYPEMPEPVELIFFRVNLGEQPPRNLAFEQIVWAEPRALPHYDFLEADREMVARMAARETEPE